MDRKVNMGNFTRETFEENPPLFFFFYYYYYFSNFKQPQVCIKSDLRVRWNGEHGNNSVLVEDISRKRSLSNLVLEKRKKEKGKRSRGKEDTKWRMYVPFHEFFPSVLS